MSPKNEEFIEDINPLVWSFFRRKQSNPENIKESWWLRNAGEELAGSKPELKKEEKTTSDHWSPDWTGLVSHQTRVKKLAINNQAQRRRREEHSHYPHAIL